MSPNLTPKVSVIVPVYNTELYVERAIISLMEQTLDDVQFIIIDDGSKDNSLNIIKQVITRYPARQGQVTLISRENRGVAATRAQGMELATGDYVIHLDSDDWAEFNWLEALYTKAIEDNADVVVCDYSMIFKESVKLVRQETKSSGVECIGQLLAGKLHGSTCNKLIRGSIVVKNAVKFNSETNYLEDYIFILKVFYYAKRVSRVDLSLLNYNKVNCNSITYEIDEFKAKNIRIAIEDIKYFLMDNGVYKDFERYFLRLCLTHKSEMICRLNSKSAKVYYDLYPVDNQTLVSVPIHFFYKTLLFFLNTKAFLFVNSFVFAFRFLKKIKTLINNM
ncbi:glycosyltransferase family 2 protein [Aeromonas caviae]|uniref:glycosyltransferase family 2 protein n=1 Tax=Aeromonas caviae TaxID=648 RepID=UPI002868C459|nr:glycosyltransferase family 2 protein [Aeromonas caviae]WMX35610.1 glycosyltransferase family 2 protein [Aeromonas caviae]